MTVKRTTQVVAESLSTTNPKARASQLVAEVLSTNALKLYCSQLVAEVLSLNDAGGGGGAPAQPVMFLMT